jgi:hypothetical protein
MRSLNEQSHAYEAPRIIELGDLVTLTAQGQGGFNKPCSVADGLSGTIGNCSGGGGGGGGIGS